MEKTKEISVDSRPSGGEGEMHGKIVAESMDFEEMESVVWRKVCIILFNFNKYAFIHYSLFRYYSINCVDFSKIEGNGGQTLVAAQHGSGSWLYLLESSLV
jgi:hypothetical protein